MTKENVSQAMLYTGGRNDQTNNIYQQYFLKPVLGTFNNFKLTIFLWRLAWHSFDLKI